MATSRTLPEPRRLASTLRPKTTASASFRIVAVKLLNGALDASWHCSPPGGLFCNPLTLAIAGRKKVNPDGSANGIAAFSTRPPCNRGWEGSQT